MLIGATRNISTRFRVSWTQNYLQRDIDKATPSVLASSFVHPSDTRRHCAETAKHAVDFFTAR